MTSTLTSTVFTPPNISGPARPVQVSARTKDALVRTAPQSPLSEVRPELEDEFSTLGVGRVLCLSRTTEPDGTRHRHVLTYSRRETVPGLPARYVVSLCSECPGFAAKSACRHAVTLTALLNHPLMVGYIEFPNEIAGASLSGASVCWCGARRHSVIVRVLGRGYVRYDLCLAMADGRECGGGGRGPVSNHPAKAGGFGFLPPPLALCE